MRGLLLKGFFRCKALSSGQNGWSRKRRKTFILPEVKRKRLLTSFLPRQSSFVGGKDAEISSDDDEALTVDGNQADLEVEEVEMQSAESSEDDAADVGGRISDVPTAPQGREEPSLYPSVVYEGKIATVSLGIGQRVILDGCAMVRAVEGQASMLGYFLPCGMDVLVCSSSKLAEAVTISARQSQGVELGEVNMIDGGESSPTGHDTLGCVLRFTSHKLGDLTLANGAAIDSGLTFKLDVEPLGKCLGHKRGRDSIEDQDQDPLDNEEVDSDQEEVSSSDGDDRQDSNDLLKVPLEDVRAPVATDSVKKWKSTESQLSIMKRQRLGLSDSPSAATNIPQSWREAVEFIMLEGATQPTSLAEDSLPSIPGPVVAVVGAKNVGKSTFARFLVNSLLNRHKEVAYLDTDVGQPEFTVPGCISLHILNHPVVGPPAMHLRAPERCFFYGDISAKSDPMMYGQNVADLHDHFRKQYQMNGKAIIPLVINTHGWVKGAGQEVLVDILKCTSPTHVVQLLTDAAKQNLPHGKFWDESSTAKTIYVESAVEKIAMRTGRSAHHLRAARVLAYFQQCFGDNPAPFPYREAKHFVQTAKSLVSEAPYEVPIAALTIKHLHSEEVMKAVESDGTIHGIPPSESLRTVNAALVGLGVNAANTVTKLNKDDQRPMVPLCVGLGLVRAVDVQKGVFYISTPVPMEQLQQVDTLLQGRVEIPVPLMMAKGYISPYLCRESLIVGGVGAAAMKSTSKLVGKKGL